VARLVPVFVDHRRGRNDAGSLCPTSTIVVCTSTHFRGAAAVIGICLRSLDTFRKIPVRFQLVSIEYWGSILAGVSEDCSLLLCLRRLLGVLIAYVAVAYWLIGELLVVGDVFIKNLLAAVD